MLPQRPEEAAYYTYGTPAAGRAQYAHPQLLNFLIRIEHLWGATDSRRLGIGNISLPSGVRFPPHRSHRSGLEVDMRPVRKDGKEQPVHYRSSDYDRAATSKLVQMMWQTGMVTRLFFSDAAVPRVSPMIGHDDHLHVEVRA